MALQATSREWAWVRSPWSKAREKKCAFGYSKSLLKVCSGTCECDSWARNCDRSISLAARMARARLDSCWDRGRQWRFFLLLSRVAILSCQTLSTGIVSSAEWSLPRCATNLKYSQ
jgi:hypothetical protein